MFSALVSRVSSASRSGISKAAANSFRVAVRPYYRAGTQYATGNALSSREVMVRGLLGASAAAGIVGICVMGQKADENTAHWNDYVSERVKSTYGHFAVGLGMTAASAAVFHRSGIAYRMMASHPIAFSIGGFVVTMGALVATRSIQYENTLAKLSAWSVFNTSIGVTLAPMLLMGGPMVMKAAIYTGAVVGSLSLVAMSANSDQFLSWGQPLAFGLGIIIVTSLGRIFLPAQYFIAHSMMDKVVTYGGLVVFSGLVLYDTQKIVYKSKYAHQFDPVNECLGIYLDTINLFQIILTMLNNRRR
eukprot:c3655_g1_i1.p1 GENE.c3655_g1_i1~~c3655_g1_i1.p1  ORF type:complete len:315 (-),score=59.34 c3655_g1_i1:154-1062(-)